MSSVSTLIFLFSITARVSGGDFNGDGIGGKTQITYTYASQYDNGLLPFPVYVASSVSLVDTLPLTQPEETYTQNFSYSGGYFDASEREFRGFAKIKVIDPNSQATYDRNKRG